MTRRGIVAMLAAAGLAADAASAQPASHHVGGLDRRVQFVDFDPDKVTTIRARLGYQLMIEFAPDERIENVSIGDAVGWQVTPNRRANIVFLKPIDGAATNMSVVTDARRYLFDLRLAPQTSKAATSYAVRFLYPAPATATIIAPPERPPQVANAAYSVTGSPENAPSRVFDDGEMTYFQWPAQAALPAIFAVAADGSESMVNYAVRGPYVVVQQLAPRFVLRNGKQVTTVANGAYPIQQAARR